MARRADANQPAIVRNLRKRGVSVCVLSSLGHGIPDILCGWRGANFLVEIKQEAGALTPDEIAWAASWDGQYAIGHSAAEIIEMMELYFETEDE